MQKKLSLSIDTPCAKDWKNFSHNSQGGFCNSCNKNVIDFTKMNDDEVLHFFVNNKSHTCGRFRQGQLKTYSTKLNADNHSGVNWIQAALVSLPLLLISKQGYSQTNAPKNKTEFVQNDQSEKKEGAKSSHIIKGTVISEEDGSSIQGVNVIIKGTSTGVCTNFEGKFEIINLKEGDVLVFSALGFEAKEYKVSKNAPEIIEVSLLMLEIAWMGEVAVAEVYVHSPSLLTQMWQKVKTIF